MLANGNSPNAPSLMRQKRVPLLNFSIGIVKGPANELVEDHTDGPVLSRDALLFDPELAARVGSPTFTSAPFDASTGRAPKVAGSPSHNSPQPVTRRKSLANALLPLKSSNRMQAQLGEPELSSPTRDNSDSDMEKTDLTLPPLPEPAALSPLPAIPMSPVDPRDIAPWSAPSAKSVDLPLSARPLLFALPSSRRSRLSATTSTTAVGPAPTAPSAPKRAYDEDSSQSLRERLWVAIQRGTGFAVGTERVLDARVRHAQQMKALRIMALNTLATVVVVIIVVAVP